MKKEVKHFCLQSARVGEENSHIRAQIFFFLKLMGQARNDKEGKTFSQEIVRAGAKIVIIKERHDVKTFTRKTYKMTGHLRLELRLLNIGVIQNFS